MKFLDSLFSLKAAEGWRDGQCLRALVTLGEAQGSTPNTHKSQPSGTVVSGDPTPTATSVCTRHTCDTHKPLKKKKKAREKTQNGNSLSTQRLLTDRKPLHRNKTTASSPMVSTQTANSSENPLGLKSALISSGNAATTLRQRKMSL